MKYLTSAARGVVALLLMLMLNASTVTGEAVVQARNASLFLSVWPWQKTKVQRSRAAARNYAKFSHSTHTLKENLACDSCHKFPTTNWREVRKGDAAFPDVAEFPEHGSCLGCHRQQFFARQRPAPAICANCHGNVTPQNTARFPFPSLGEPFLATAGARDFVSEFQVTFPHDKHTDASCEDCHQTYQPQGASDSEFVTNPPKGLDDGFWLKKGTFKTRPITHAQCFSCHNQESELAPLPSRCDACHKPRPAEKRATDLDEQLLRTIGIQDWFTTTSWRSRSSAGTFRHEVHADVKCAQCHQAVTPNAVAVSSCGGAEGCHVTATSGDGGILNYEVDQKKENAGFVCTKCHTDFGKAAVPESHLKAIEALKKPAVAQGQYRSAVTWGAQRNIMLKVSYAPAEPHYSADTQVQMKVPDNTDYSKFQHTSSYHARLPCSLCHRRETNAARPSLPGGKDHLPCAGCHVKQFADSSNAICTNCHSNPPAPTLKQFPKLSSFNMKFDHARHVRTTCTTCHRPLRGGVALTIPTGPNAHVTCFQCHGPSAKAGDRDISSCGVCHETGRHARSSQMARAFRIGFSHAQHDRDEGLSCKACHRVRAGAQKKDVTAPQPLNHRAAARSFSCLTCHNGKRAFGGDDFSACKRCHKGSAWHF